MVVRGLSKTRYLLMNMQAWRKRKMLGALQFMEEELHIIY